MMNIFPTHNFFQCKVLRISLLLLPRTTGCQHTKRRVVSMVLEKRLNAFDSSKHTLFPLFSPVILSTLDKSNVCVWIHSSGLKPNPGLKMVRLPTQLVFAPFYGRHVAALFDDERNLPLGEMFVWPGSLV